MKICDLITVAGTLTLDTASEFELELLVARQALEVKIACPMVRGRACMRVRARMCEPQ